MIEKQTFSKRGDIFCVLTARQTIAKSIDIKKYPDVLALFSRKLLYSIAEVLPVKFSQEGNTLTARVMILNWNKERDEALKEFEDLNKLNDELIAKTKVQEREIASLNDTLNKLMENKK